MKVGALMDMLLYAVVVSLPVLAFVIGKAVLKRWDGADGFSAEKRSAARRAYAASFLAGAIYAIALYVLAVTTDAALTNAVQDGSVEYGALLALTIAAGFALVKIKRKLFRSRGEKLRTESGFGKLRIVVPFCFGAIGGSTGLWPLGMLEDGLAGGKGVVCGFIDWYVDSLRQNDLGGAIKLWFWWIVLVGLSCLITLITSIVIIKKSKTERKVM